MKTKLLSLFILGIVSLASWKALTFTSSTKQTPATAAPVTQADSTATTKKWIDKQTQTIVAQADNLNPNVVKVSLTAYLKARQEGLDNKQILTIVDYSKPSSERRLWVVDLKTDKVLFNTWVAHGKNSGDATSTSFSNSASSLKSSLGVFTTKDTYEGHHGYSLRIQGLEHGINDNAYSRDIVFHGAPYVGADIAKSRGKVGRSWGCLAVAPQTITPLVNAIKGETVVVAYYPDKHWLQSSTFLNARSA